MNGHLNQFRLKESVSISRSVLLSPTVVQDALTVNGIRVVSAARRRGQAFPHIGAAKSASRRCRLIAAGGFIKMSIHELSLTAPKQWDDVNRHSNPEFLLEVFKALVFVTECGNSVHLHSRGVH